MKFNWRTEWLMVLVIFGMFVLAAAAWPTAPQHFPTHWGVHGVDAYGSRFEGLLLNPLMALGIYALTLVVPRFDPGKANYAQFAGAYTTIRLVIVLFLAVIYVLTVLVAYGRQLDLLTIVLPMFGAVLIVLGNSMGKIRPNWFVGIRTPWTLSSKASWDRTHRFGGWLFIAGGLIVAASVGLPATLMVAMCAAVPLGIVVACFVYSYFAWRADPDKQPPAGTLPASNH